MGPLGSDPARFFFHCLRQDQGRGVYIILPFMNNPCSERKRWKAGILSSQGRCSGSCADPFSCPHCPRSSSTTSRTTGGPADLAASPDLDDGTQMFAVFFAISFLLLHSCRMLASVLCESVQVIEPRRSPCSGKRAVHMAASRLEAGARQWPTTCNPPVSSLRSTRLPQIFALSGCGLPSLRA